MAPPGSKDSSQLGSSLARVRSACAQHYRSVVIQKMYNFTNATNVPQFMKLVESREYHIMSLRNIYQVQ